MSEAVLEMESPTTVEPKALEHGDLLAHDAVPAALISMRDIWRTYEMGTEKLHALRGVSFDVQRGEYLAIIGPSGSGKSTLMNLIGCLDTPSQGRYWINSKLVSEMEDDELARIGHRREREFDRDQLGVVLAVAVLDGVDDRLADGDANPVDRILFELRQLADAVADDLDEFDHLVLAVDL